MKTPLLLFAALLAALFVGASAVPSRGDAGSGLIAWWRGEGDATDSAGANDGTLHGGYDFPAGVDGHAFRFNGVDGGINVADLDDLKLTQSLSIAAWVSLDHFPEFGWGQIVFRGDDRGGLDPYMLAVHHDGYLAFHVESETAQANLTAAVPVVGHYFHVAGTLDDETGVMRLYVNGAVAAETVTAVRPLRDLDPEHHPGLGIGHHPGYPDSPWPHPLAGSLDEVRLYDRALGADEVAGLLQHAPAAPSDLRTTALSPSEIGLSWSDNSDNEVGFSVEQRGPGEHDFTPVGSADADAPHFVVDGLQPHSGYGFRVRALGAALSSEPSNVAEATTLELPPLAPSDLHTTGVTASSVSLAWQDNSDNETAFILERRRGAEAFHPVATLDPGTTSATDDGLLPAATYAYRVFARGHGGDSAPSEVLEATTLPHPPIAPARLHVTAVSTTSVSLAWEDASDNENGFELFRHVEGEHEDTTLSLAADVTSYEDTGLEAGTTYVYSIRSVNAGGASERTSAVEAATPLAVGGRLRVPARVVLRARVGHSDTAQIQVRNESTTERLRVRVAGIEGPFVLVTQVGSFLLEPGAHRTLRVRFRPKRAGRVNGKLRLRSSDPDHLQVTVRLQATGVR
jgi:chitodextrinase